MKDSEAEKGNSFLGFVFIFAGVLILVLSVLNYFQDGKISLVSVIGLLGIFLGFYWVANAKKAKSSNE